MQDFTPIMLEVNITDIDTFNCEMNTILWMYYNVVMEMKL